MIEILKMLSTFMLMLVSGPQSELPSDTRTLLIDGQPSTECTQWVDSVYNTLSERERVAQLFVPHLVIGDNEAGRATLRRMVKEQGVGGILLGKGTIDSYAALINLAQSEAAVPLMVTLDGEWGLAMRVEGTPRYPYNMALGAITDTRLLYDYGRELARECKALGIQVDFAPVIDVNSNPDNPVIGYRSYGEDPVRVAKAGVAFSRGMEAEGVMSVAKHFPGHGDTNTDSHLALPTIDHNQSTLEKVDLLPFKKYIEAGLTGVMVGHLNVPALDNTGQPASLSAKVTTDLLRKKLGFKGMVFTDALEMKGAVPRQGGNNCVAALEAGADVLLGSASPARDIDAVVQAVASGRLSKELIEQRCRKMLAYKYELGLTKAPKINLAGLKTRINSQQAADINQALADAAITVTANSGKLIPVPALESNRVVVVSIGAKSGNEFSDLCRKYVDCQLYSVDASGLTAATMNKIKEADIVVTAVMSDKAWARDAFAKIRAAKPDEMIPVFLINPYKMRSFGDLTALPELVLAYDDTPALRRAAAMAIFGGIEVSGRMPVDVRQVAPLGAGVTIAKSRLGYASPQAMGFAPGLTSAVDSIVEAAIKAKAFPGCQVLVAREGEIVLDKSYGNQSFEGSVAVTDRTLYDIASMSKATGTLAGVMKAYDEGLFRLGDKASRHVPGLDRPDKKDITVSDLLYHESGMPASLNMYKVMFDTASYSGPLTRATRTEQYPLKLDARLYGNRDAKLRRDITSPTATELNDVAVARGIYVGDAAYDTIMSRIYDIKLRRDKSYNYSCLNFALLMEMEQRLTGVSHDQWVETEVFGPIGANLTGYRPTEYYDAAKIAPTEVDNFLRKQTLQGYVHDEMAAFSGGVQGNAGLFSNAGDIAKLCQTWLNGGKYGDRQVFKPSTVETFLGSRSKSGRRGLGFDVARGLKSLAEAGAGPRTIGHTGFTGTCFWIDPDHELIYIFLSNRVHPSRDNAAFSRLNPRAAILAAIYTHLRQPSISI